MQDIAHRGSRERIPSATVKLVIQSANKIGVDTKTILKNAGISGFNTDKVLYDTPLSRVQFTPVYLACMTALTQSIGRQEGIRPGNFDDFELLGSCVVNCSNLLEVINQSIKFVNALNGRLGSLSFDRNGSRATLSIGRPGQHNIACRGVRDFFRICFYYKLFSWLVSEPLAEASISISRQQFIEEKTLRDIVNCPVKVSKGRDLHNTLTFDADFLTRPIIRTHHEFKQVLEVSPFELLPLPPSSRLANILEGVFRKSLAERSPIPTVEIVAKQLGQSGATLRRRLSQENTSFQILLDKCRTEKAIELLAHTDLTIDDIAFDLGFSAPSGFSRAFKDWTGHPPSAYRLTLQHA